MDFLFQGANSSSGPPSPHARNQEERRVQVESGKGPGEGNKPDPYNYGEWQHVNSSWIAAMRFNPIGRYAQMRTKKGGKIYTFGGMIFAAFYSWFNAPSKGKYFNRHLKGRYTQ